MRFIAAFVLFAALAHAQNRLVLIQRDWASAPTTESTDCVDVNTDSSYRFEQTSDDSGQPAARTKIRAGKLTFQERAQLIDLLNDPAVLSLSTPHPASKLPSGGEFWRISIPRGDHQQLLTFANSSNQSYELTVRGGAKSIYKTLAMKPLLDWYQQLTKRRDPIDKAATPSCSLPVRQR